MEIRERARLRPRLRRELREHAIGFVQGNQHGLRAERLELRAAIPAINVTHESLRSGSQLSTTLNVAQRFSRAQVKFALRPSRMLRRIQSSAIGSRLRAMPRPPVSIGSKP